MAMRSLVSRARSPCPCPLWLCLFPSARGAQNGTSEVRSRAWLYLPTTVPVWSSAHRELTDAALERVHETSQPPGARDCS
eukprot:6613908-Prymnesium_polylepis.1